MSEIVRCLVSIIDGLDESLRGTRVSHDVVRLNESSFLCEEYTLGTEVFVSPAEDDAVLIGSVRSESPFATHRLGVLPPQLLASPRLQRLLETVEEEGGHWEQIAGATVLIHVPKGKDTSIPERLASVERGLENG